MRLIRILVNQSPRQNFHALTAKLRRRRGESRFTEADLRRAPKYLNAVTEIDRFERYARVCIRNGQADPRESLSGSVVLELGCGPVLGIAPMAVFRGARVVYYSEPAFNPELPESELVVEGYLRPLHAELCAEFNPAVDDFRDFESYYETLLRRFRPLDGDPPQEAVDFVYSNSVLEHIPSEELGGVLRLIRSVCSPRARFLHAVDFTDHQARAFPFGEIYRAEPPADLGSRDINLLRPTELRELFEQAGFEVSGIPYRRFRRDLEPLAEFWRRFPKEALEIMVALFVGHAR